MSDDQLICGHRRRYLRRKDGCSVCADIAQRAAAAIAAGRRVGVGGNPRPRRFATCHPSRFLHGNGLCARCYQRERARANPHQPSDEVKQRSHLMRLYGLTVEDYGAIVDRQGGVCAICQETRPLVVDHDHDSGEVRGLLCRRCNAGIGQLRDDPILVEIALGYLAA